MYLRQKAPRNFLVRNVTLNVVKEVIGVDIYPHRSIKYEQIRIDDIHVVRGDGEIKLSDMVTHKSEDFTFEFNDMKESFGEGICTLLQSRYLVNGTKAYSIAEVIAAQSIVGTAVVCEGAEDVMAA